MKILTGTHVREADLYTMEHEPVSSIDLMERASIALYERIKAAFPSTLKAVVFVGKGNNGGDGLAVARLLSLQGYACDAVLVFPENEMSEDSRINLKRLRELKSSSAASSDDPGIYLFPEYVFPSSGAFIIDAVLGTGVRGAVRGIAAEAIRKIDEAGFPVVAIDLPSGLPTEYCEDESRLEEKGATVHADLTLTIEFPKLSLLLPRTGRFAGRVEVVPISLSEEYKAAVPEHFHYVDTELLKEFRCRERDIFSHKGNFGHTLLICGCSRMMGAAILSTGAALRSGCGLVTVHIPRSGCTAMNIAHPSAMLSLDQSDFFTTVPENLEKYTSIAAGCGMGTDPLSAEALEQVMQAGIPMVLDADALNLLSLHRRLLESIPEESVLTPHVGELRRLIGSWKDEREKIEKCMEFSRRYRVILLIKGAYTMTVLPSGEIYVNSTGNAGMAKGGSGDLLAGLIAGLISRGYPSRQAAVLGVYVHGLAGDRCARERGTESMNSRDLLDYINLPLSDL